MAQGGAPPKVCLVVPTYNERENVDELVGAIKELGIPGLQLLFVDDSSPDGTGEAIKEIGKSEPWVHLLSRSAKMGIGSAYVDGFRFARTEFSPEILVQMDADFQHPPKITGELVRAVEKGADMSLASRYVPGGGMPGWGRFRRLVSWGANAYARRMLGLTVRDCTSGFRAFGRDAIARLVDSSLPARGFEFQVATLYVLRGMNIVEIPYTFEQRRSGASKLGLVDVLRFAVNIVKIARSGNSAK